MKILFSKFKNYLKNKFSLKQKNLIKHYFYRALYRDNLIKLATAFNTDKYGSHFYAEHYQTHFEALRKQKLNILEIGVGGYEEPKAGGGSLRLWKAYFTNSNIYGIDIYDKTPHNAKRIKTYKGSQVDKSFLKKIKKDIGPINIIIDDGSHFNEHVITSFNILFPLLENNGIYVIEDLQTSYWEEVIDIKWGGSKNLNAPHTSMNFLKGLIDGLNYEEFTLNNYTPDYFDKHITSIHFYHNLAFIYKGLNNEGSNIIGSKNKE